MRVDTVCQLVHSLPADRNLLLQVVFSHPAAGNGQRDFLILRMNNVTTLPIVEARKILDRRLEEDRSVEWAIDYHRKCRLMIEEDRERGDFFSVYDGDICITLKLGIDLEVEQAMRALINRINDLESQSR